MKSPVLIGIIVAIIAVIGAVYWLGYTHSKPPVVNNYTTNSFTIADSIPASVSNINITTPDGKPGKAEYATMDTTLTSPSGNSKVSLGIGYNEYSNLFNLRANFSETIPDVIPPKPKFARLTGQVGIGFKQDEMDQTNLSSADLALGVKFVDKYSVCAFVDSRSTFGLRLGVDF